VTLWTVVSLAGAAQLTPAADVARGSLSVDATILRAGYAAEA
jgi:hypothetical protein